MNGYHRCLLHATDLQFFSNQGTYSPKIAIKAVSHISVLNRCSHLTIFLHFVKVISKEGIDAPIYFINRVQGFIEHAKMSLCHHAKFNISFLRYSDIHSMHVSGKICSLQFIFYLYFQCGM